MSRRLRSSSLLAHHRAAQWSLYNAQLRCKISLMYLIGEAIMAWPVLTSPLWNKTYVGHVVLIVATNKVQEAALIRAGLGRKRQGWHIRSFLDISTRRGRRLTKYYTILFFNIRTKHFILLQRKCYHLDININLFKEFVNVAIHMYCYYITMKYWII